MLESEKFAIAAHLHVLLRRINGRVTDVEWMIRSPEYAQEVIRVARTEDNPELLKLADKLEQAVMPQMMASTSPAKQPGFFASVRAAASTTAEAKDEPLPAAPTGQRYVGSLR